jgi:hypothetical protein
MSMAALSSIDHAARELRAVRFSAVQRHVEGLWSGQRSIAFASKHAEHNIWSYADFDKRRNSSLGILVCIRSQGIGLELPRWHLSFKHDIQLFIRSTLHLRDTKVAPHQAWYAEATEEEAQFPSKVGFVWIDQVRYGDSHDDAKNSLYSSSDSDGLGAYASCANLAEDGKGNRADTPIVYRVPDQEPDGISGSLSIGTSHRAYRDDFAQIAPVVGTRSKIPTRNMSTVNTVRPIMYSTRLPNFCIKYHESNTLTHPIAMKPIPMLNA